MAGKHLIGKFTWEIQIPSSKDAYAIQQKTSEWVWRELEPELERLFDQWAEPDKVLKLDFLEVNLGTIEFSQLSKEAILPALSKALEKAFSKSKREPRQASLSRRPDLEPNRSLPLAQHYFEIWLYWLEEGVLPPYYLSPEPGWLLHVWETLAKEYRAVDTLAMKVSASDSALERLVLQHNNEDLRMLVEILTGHSQAKLKRVLAEIQSLFPVGSAALFQMTYRALETEFWKVVFEAVLIDGSISTDEDLIDLCIEKTSFNYLARWFQHIVALNTSEYPVLQEVFARARPGSFTDGPFLNDPAQRAPEIPHPQTGHHKLPEEQTFPTPQFFRNAGVVLLHPFLPNFFKRSGLLDGNGFLDENCRAEAVLLLHYLATGEDNTRDHALTLPKFLCGIPLNRPMDHTLRVSEVARQESEQLLQAAIDHWGALGNTSPDGLRAGFLIREGKLIREQSGWKLYVEQNTMDILLDRLPWNLSLVKLPWMQEMLKVEWR